MSDPKTQKDLYKPTYRHFKLRLLKRYGIRIDFYDYCMLHNVKLSMKQNKFNSKGQVSIQGVFNNSRYGGKSYQIEKFTRKAIDYRFTIN